MATRLLRGGHRVVAYDLNEVAIQSLEAAGAEGARTQVGIAARLASPHSVWWSGALEHYHRTNDFGRGRGAFERRYDYPWR
jgi:hypothetical protein